MNSREITEFFDTMSPTSEQKSRMLNRLLESKGKVKLPLKRYVAIMATVFATAIGVAVYSATCGTDVTYEKSENVSMDAEHRNMRASEESVEQKSALYDTAEDFAYAENAVITGSGLPTVFNNSVQKEFSLDDIRNDDVYSKVFPVYFARGYEFENAVKNDNFLDVTLVNKESEYMSVIVAKESTEPVTEPEGIFTLEHTDGDLRFAGKCGDYYVIYNAKAEELKEIYKMVTSSQYFENTKG